MGHNAETLHAAEEYLLGEYQGECWLIDYERELKVDDNSLEILRSYGKKAVIPDLTVWRKDGDRYDIECVVEINLNNPEKLVIYQRLKIPRVLWVTQDLEVAADVRTGTTSDSAVFDVTSPSIRRAARRARRQGFRDAWDAAHRWASEMIHTQDSRVSRQVEDRVKAESEEYRRLSYRAREAKRQLDFDRKRLMAEPYESAMAEFANDLEVMKFRFAKHNRPTIRMPSDCPKCGSTLVGSIVFDFIGWVKQIGYTVGDWWMERFHSSPQWRGRWENQLGTYVLEKLDLELEEDPCHGLAPSRSLDDEWYLTRATSDGKRIFRRKRLPHSPRLTSKLTLDDRTQ